VGPPDHGANLYKGSFVPYQPTAKRVIEDDDNGLLEQPGPLYTAKSPAGPAAYLCVGDSGGPLVDRLSIANASGVNQSQPAVFAVSSSNTRTPGTACTDPGDDNFWVQTEGEQEFLRYWVSQWYPGLLLQRGPGCGELLEPVLGMLGKALQGRLGVRER
jgi:hypothetical protein